MINGQLTMLADCGATLQFECEECVGEGYIPISNEEVVTCKECGWSRMDRKFIIDTSRFIYQNRE